MEKIVLPELGLYPVTGIWGWLQRLPESLPLLDWSCRVVLSGVIVEARPWSGSKKPLLVSFASFAQAGSQITVEKVNQGWQVEIPVYWQGRQFFSLVLVTENELAAPVFHNLQFSLQLLLEHEIGADLPYPTWFPFFYRSDFVSDEINQRLLSAENFFFLNGQAGTGKRTFVFLYLLYHFGIYIDPVLAGEPLVKSLQLATGDREFWYVPELALLEPQWQEKLLQKIHSNEPALFFVASVYPPQALQVRGILLPELAEICEKNRLLFPSLSRRLAELPGLLDFWQSFSAASLSSIVHRAEDLPVEQMSENLRSLRQLVSAPENRAASAVESEIKLDVSRDGQLRNLVADLEVAAIRLAHSRVGNSQNKIASFLGISRGSLQHKLKKYNLPYQNWEE